MNKALKILLKNFEAEVRITRGVAHYTVSVVVRGEVITYASNANLRVAASDAFCGFVAKQGISQIEKDALGRRINKACGVL
jgi:hypothetical protein